MRTLDIFLQDYLQFIFAFHGTNMRACLDSQAREADSYFNGLNMGW
jgi:hypothetical protein